MIGSFSNGGLGMGVAFFLEDDFSKTAREIQNSMRDLGGATEAMARGIEQSLNRIKLGIAAMGIGIGLLAPLKKGMDVRAEFQAFEVQFETLFKSAEKAKSFMSDIKMDAADSPIFGTSSLVAANAALVSNGIEAQRARTLVNDLGNALAGVGRGDVELKSMAVNLQQIATNGKASSMDIKQFAMAGLPIYRLLSDATGKTAEELKDMDVTLEQLEKAFRFAATSQGMFYQATERAANSTKGLKAAMEDNIELTFERIGAAIEPMTRKLYTNLNNILNTIKEFVSTPLGANIVRLIGYIGIFLTVGGALLVLMGGLRFAAFKMAGAFAENTKAMIVQTLATKGLTAGFKEMAKAAWLSLGPYLIIAAAIAAFVYIAKEAWAMLDSGSEKMFRFGTIILWMLGPLGQIIWLVGAIRRGFKELNNWEGDKGGIIGFFMRVAAVIESVGQIWSSFNGETFALTDELAAKLEAMGILDFVIALGTWISRIKMFFMSFIDTLAAGWEWLSVKLANIWDRIKEGVGSIFERLSGIFERLGRIFRPIIDLVDKILVKLGFGKGALEDWGNAGSMVGNEIVFILNVIITVIGLVVDAILWVIDTWLALVTAILDGVIWIIDGISAIVDTITEWVNMMFGLTETAYEFGVAFMEAIWSGLKEIWESVSQWLTETVGEALKMFTNPWDTVKTGAGKAWDWLTGGDDDNNNPVSPVAPVTPTGGAGGAFHPTVTSKTAAVAAQAQASPQQGTVPNETFNLTLMMDGDKVADRVITKQELKSDRA